MERLILEQNAKRLIPRATAPGEIDWLVDDEGNLAVEFVGRFENLREHFRRVCEILRVSPELPHLNRTRHGHYRDYYDQESRAIIERVEGV